MNYELHPSAAAEKLGGTSYARVRDVIRRDIVGGVFEAGARLKAVELAARYGVSQVPVREALQQLQGEGLVDIEPNRGARVRRIDAKFVSDVFEIRLRLSELLAAKAAERMTPAALAELERRQQVFEAAIAAGDVPSILQANRRFHDVYFRVADNPEAEKLMEQHRAMCHALRTKIGYSRGRLPTMIEEHRGLMHAFAMSRPLAAARWARRHTRASHEDVQRQLAASLQMDVAAPR